VRLRRFTVTEVNPDLVDSIDVQDDEVVSRNQPYIATSLTSFVAQLNAKA
jgi:hypothetical protein